MTTCLVGVMSMAPADLERPSAEGGLHEVELAVPVEAAVAEARELDHVAVGHVVHHDLGQGRLVAAPWPARLAVAGLGVPPRRARGRAAAAAGGVRVGGAAACWPRARPSDEGGGRRASCGLPHAAAEGADVGSPRWR